MLFNILTFSTFLCFSNFHSHILAIFCYYFVFKRRVFFILFGRLKMSSKVIEHLDLAKLPVKEKENICQILDQNDSWEELGLLMQFTEFDVAVS